MWKKAAALGAALMLAGGCARSPGAEAIRVELADRAWMQSDALADELDRVFGGMAADVYAERAGDIESAYIRARRAASTMDEAVEAERLRARKMAELESNVRRMREQLAGLTTGVRDLGEASRLLVRLEAEEARARAATLATAGTAIRAAIPVLEEALLPPRPAPEALDRAAQIPTEADR